TLLAAIEIDAPAAERHGGRSSALRSHHARCAAAGAIACTPTLDDDHAFSAAQAGEVGCPAPDRAGSDNHQIGPVACHRPAIIARGFRTARVVTIHWRWSERC